MSPENKNALGDGPTVPGKRQTAAEQERALRLAPQRFTDQPREERKKEIESKRAKAENMRRARMEREKQVQKTPPPIQPPVPVDRGVYSTPVMSAKGKEPMQMETVPMEPTLSPIMTPRHTTPRPGYVTPVNRTSSFLDSTSHSPQYENAVSTTSSQIRRQSSRDGSIPIDYSQLSFQLSDDNSEDELFTSMGEAGGSNVQSTPQRPPTQYPPVPTRNRVGDVVQRGLGTLRDLGTFAGSAATAMFAPRGPSTNIRWYDQSPDRQVERRPPPSPPPMEPIEEAREDIRARNEQNEIAERRLRNADRTRELWWSELPKYRTVRTGPPKLAPVPEAVPVGYTSSTMHRKKTKSKRKRADSED